ncbi:low molecular weight phosphatase family protein [Aureimonas sp. OT7]|nr:MULTISPECIES: low molecular weight phosphatase family protein [Aureimonas]QOG06531.1 low molecular weight phosphatase family protein [Aureimonas sp. OT7]
MTPGTTLPRSILFVCGMNSIRSPMAEVLARSLLPGTVYIASAGVKDGQPDPFVDAILREEGLPPVSAPPRRMDDMEDGFFDMIVTMSPEAHHHALEHTGAEAVTIEFWPMPDPSATTGSREQILDAYRDVFHRIEAKVRDLRARSLASPA